jgi:hypothetical protein
MIEISNFNLKNSNKPQNAIVKPQNFTSDLTLLGYSKFQDQELFDICSLPFCSGK